MNIYSFLCRLGGSRILRFAGIALVVMAWSNFASCARHRDVTTVDDAARHGDLAKVKALLKEDSDLVFSRDEFGFTPLHWAAWRGHKDIAELLIANKAEINSRGKNGETPLYLASSEGHREVVELLLSRKADVNTREGHGMTALHAAACGGTFDHGKRASFKEVVALLLANKAEVNARDKYGMTPLHRGSTCKAVEEVLLANNADVNAKDNNGHTALHLAAAGGYADVAELLRRHGGHE